MPRCFAILQGVAFIISSASFAILSLLAPCGTPRSGRASLFAGLCSGRLAAGSIGRRGKLQNGLLGQRLKTSRQLVNQTILHG